MSSGKAPKSLLRRAYGLLPTEVCFEKTVGLSLAELATASRLSSSWDYLDRNREEYNFRNWHDPKLFLKEMHLGGRMEQFNEQAQKDLKNSRLQLLSESLSAMRVAETADVTLTCGDTEFPAHKLILEASTPYFVTMFKTGLEEAKTGIVVFKEMAPDTLEAIVDYLYLGEVNKIKTEQEVKNVLAASHLMRLEQLVEYCCDVFVASLSSENFLRIWNTIKVFEKDDVETKILDYLVANYSDIESSNEFVCLNFDQMRRFLDHAKVKVSSLDNIVIGLLRWLRYDLDRRDQFAKDLFASLDALLVSKEFITDISLDEDIMTSSVEITNGIKDLFFTVHTFSDRCKIVEPLMTSCVQPLQSMKLIFFSEYRMKETQLGYTTTSCLREMRPQSYNCVQQFDLQTMTWQPLKKLCCHSIKEAAMVQNERKIYMLGGSLGKTGVVYDIDTNSIEYIGDCIVNPRKNAGICVVNHELYLVGGSDDSGPKKLVESTKLPLVSDKLTKWEEYHHLEHFFSNPTIIASFPYIFIMGDSKLVHIDYIEYMDIEKLNHGFLQMAEIPTGINLHVTVVGQTVYGFYSECETTMQMTNKEIGRNKWQVSVLNESLLNITEMTCIPQGPEGLGPHLVYVSLSYGLRLPEYVWEPEVDKWTKLPPPTGRCEIPIDDAIPKVYAVGV